MKTKWELLREAIEENKARNLELFKKIDYIGLQGAAEEDDILLHLMDRLEEHEEFMKGLKGGA